jgi:hypothetical protein
MGLFNFIHKNATKFNNKQLTNLIEIYSKIDKEELADYFIFSVWTRAGLQIEGNIVLSDGYVNLSPEIDYSMYKLFFDVSNHFRKNGRKADAAAISIWAHSANGVVTAELECDLRKLWELIASTSEYWDEYLQKTHSHFEATSLSKETLDKTMSLSRQILENSPPSQYK